MATDIIAKEIGNKLEPEKESEVVVSDSADVVEYDDLLSSAGEFGRYQLRLFISVLPFYMFCVFVYYGQMFMTEVSPNHWCWIPELENLTDIDRRRLAIPADDSARFGYSQCQVYDANWTEVLINGQKPDNTWKTLPCQHGWEFNKTEIPYPTISSEQGWVCERNSYQATAQALFFVGSIFGGFIIGWVSDRYGRVPAAISSNLIGGIAGFASIFSRNFSEFATCRFFMGISYDNCYMMTYLIVLEYVAPKYRTLISNMSFALYYSFFVTILPWIALACGHWKTLGLVTSLPLAGALLTPFFIPESPRWLLSKGHVDAAVEKVLTIGRINRKEVPAKIVERFKATFSENKKTEEHYSIIEIFKRPILRKMFICICLEHMCCNIAFDGLVRSIGQLDFDLFMSFSLVSFTEFPSMIVAAFIMDWTGRRWLTLIFMALCCIFSISTMFVSGLQSVMAAVVARFAVNIAYSAVIQWGAELLPTPVRGGGLSIIHICGYIATVLSPYIVYLETVVRWLPLVLIGCVAGFGGIIAIILPETAKRTMPHTFDDAEQMVRNQNMWEMPWRNKQEDKIDRGHVNDNFTI